MGARRKARECALQMLFALDVAEVTPEQIVGVFWRELCDTNEDEGVRAFADSLVRGAKTNLVQVDEKIRSRAQHWRISRMAIVDRNVLRLAVYEFLYEQTPPTVVINEALEIARRYSTLEATQFINGILDAIKQDIEREGGGKTSETDRQIVSV